MKKKITDIIGMTIISIVIIILNLIVGANEKGLRTLPLCIMLCFEALYLIIKKVFFKQKIVIKNKIDETMHDKMPKKRENSGLLEDQIEYTKELLDLLKEDARFAIILRIRAGKIF